MMRKIIVYITEELSDLSDKDHKQFWWNHESPHNIVQKHISNYTTPESGEEVYVMVNAYKKWHTPFKMEFISPIMCDARDPKNKLNMLELQTYYKELSLDSDVISKYKEEFFKPHSNKIRTDVTSGKTRVILFHALEGYYGINFNYISDILGIPKESIIYISGDAKISNRGYDVECHFYNYWERSSKIFAEDRDPKNIHFNKQLELITNKTVRPYHNTFYNRQYRDHRLQLMASLHRDNLLSTMIWSWGGLKKEDPNVSVLRNLVKTDPQFVDSYIAYLSSGESLKTTAAMKEVLNWEHIQNGKPSIEDLNINLVWTLNFDHIYNVYYQLICETWATGGQTCFLSEKAYKPFILGQPFVQWGDPGAVGILRDGGYDTYDKWIDHSYDLLSNTQDRLDGVNRTVTKLNSMSLADHAEMLYEMRHAIDHNFHNLSQAENNHCLFDW